MRPVLAALFLLGAASVFAEEPGYFKLDPPSEVKPAWPKAPTMHFDPRGPEKMPAPLLAEKFARARGLKAYEVQTLHYNRVACQRRIFSQSGLSIEGDADLKSTSVGDDLAEIEFPAYINMNSFNSVNPFGNGVISLETMTGRRLVKTHPWLGEKPLVLNKKVTVTFDDERKPVHTDAVTEVRVTEEGYPSTFVIKETILLPNKFSLYFICQ